MWTPAQAGQKDAAAQLIGETVEENQIIHS
jgi:hypothetical protein